MSQWEPCDGMDDGMAGWQAAKWSTPADCEDRRIIHRNVRNFPGMIQYGYISAIVH